MKQFLSFLLLLLLFSSCGKNRFEVSFTLGPDVNANYRLTFHAASSRQSMIVETVAAVAKGKARLTCPASRPTVVFIFQGNNTAPAALFWARRGDDIKITGSSPDPLTWKIGGNKINDALTEWRLASADDLRTADPARINAAVERLVRKEPDSDLAPLLLLTYYSRRDDENGFLTLWNLTDEDKRTEMSEAVGRADLLATSPAPAPDLRQLTLHTLAEGADTLYPTRAKATIFYFWSPGCDDRFAAVDTLKALSRAFPDSSRRLIADICLEPDSGAWVRSTLRDSIRGGISRGWLPAGLASEEAIAMAVPRPAFFIVADKSGRQTFRGHDAAKAAAAFRSLLKKP